MRSLLLIVILGITRASNEICQEGYTNNGKSITFDRTCSRNCSQEMDTWIFIKNNCSQYPPRIHGDTQFFNCSIGGQEEVTTYREHNPNFFEKASQKFSAPKIKDVELYFKCFGDCLFRQEMALKFHFLLPPGIAGSQVSDSIMAQAVLLRFESVPDESVQDEYYYNCPRERIFRFHNYTLVNGYDLDNPRELSYDCLVGLKTSHKVVYNITLLTVQGKSASYITTVVPRPPSFVSTTIPWQPVIMTYVNANEQTINVVVEKAPSLYQVQSYIVQLIRESDMTVRGSIIINFKDNKYANHSTFRNVSDGQYHIKVIPRCPQHCKVNTTSYRIRHFMAADDSPHYLEATTDHIQVLLMVLGCTAGVALAIFLVCFLRRHKQHEPCPGQKPSGYIIHPHRKSSPEYERVIQLKRFMMDNCDCTVKDYLDINFNANHSESREEMIKNSLREVSFVVVIYSENGTGTQTGHDDLERLYFSVLEKTIEQRKRNNNLRIVELRLPSKCSVCPLILTEHRKHIKTVTFCAEPEQLYCKIHGVRKCPENNANSALKANNQYKQFIALFQSNHESNQRVSRQIPQPDEEPLLSSNKNQKSECIAPKHGDVSAIFDQMKLLNQDTDGSEDFDSISVDIPITSGHCSINTEADVHISLDSQHKHNDSMATHTVHSARAVVKEKSNNKMADHEHFPHFCSDPSEKCCHVISQQHEAANIPNHNAIKEQSIRTIQDNHCPLRNGESYHTQYKKNNHRPGTKSKYPPRGDLAAKPETFSGFNNSDSSDESNEPYIRRTQQRQFKKHNANFTHQPHFQGPHHFSDHHHYLPREYYDTHDNHDNHIRFSNGPMSEGHFRPSYNYGRNTDSFLHSYPPEFYLGHPSVHQHQLNNHHYGDALFQQNNHFPDYDLQLSLGQQHSTRNVPNNFVHIPLDSANGYNEPVDTHMQGATSLHPFNSGLTPAREHIGRFDAVDPPSNRTQETLVKTKPATPTLTRSGSSKSLPSEIWLAPSDSDGDQTINDFNKYNPCPPDDVDEKGSSDLIEKMLEINQTYRAKD